MNTRFVLRWMILCASMLGLFAVASVAQQPRAGAVRTPGGRAAAAPGDILTTDLKVRRLEGMGRSNLVRTPEFRSSISGGTKPAREWCEIRATFDTAPEWIEEIVFQYYVLTHNPKEKAPYSFYQATVRYGDVEKGRGHLSAVYLTPAALKRFGYPVAIGLEVSVNGKLVDSMSDRDGSVRVEEGWWKNPNIVGKEVVVSRQGYLLNRKETPFALVNIDDHEVIR